MKFTEKSIKALTTDKPHRDFVDDSLRFFGIRVTSKGTKKFFVRVGTRKQLPALASYAEKHVTRFRSRAEKAKTEVVRTSLEIVALQAEQTARIARARLAALDRDAAAIKALRAEYEAALPALLDRYSQWLDPLFGQAMRGALDEAQRAAR